jgi:hypothetical protein
MPGVGRVGSRILGKIVDSRRANRYIISEKTKKRNWNTKLKMKLNRDSRARMGPAA